MSEEFEGIHDGNIDQVLQQIQDEGRSRGLIPRNYGTHPSGYHAVAPTFPDNLLVPESEWADRLAKQQADKSSLWDIREDNYSTLKSLDQDGLGLCWAFSSTKATMYARAVQNELFEILSAWYVAGREKDWRDQGGWGAESMGRIASEGVPRMELCPSYSSRYDTPDVAADAALHTMTNWLDGTESREQNRKIMVTAFLMGWPCVLDYNYLSHSMAGCYLASLNPLTVYTDNSWNDISQYGPKGTMKLVGNKAIPDGIVVARVAKAGG